MAGSVESYKTRDVYSHVCSGLRSQSVTEINTTQTTTDDEFTSQSSYADRPQCPVVDSVSTAATRADETCLRQRASERVSA